MKNLLKYDFIERGKFIISISLLSIILSIALDFLKIADMSLGFLIGIFIIVMYILLSLQRSLDSNSIYLEMSRPISPKKFLRARWLLDIVFFVIHISLYIICGSLIKENIEIIKLIPLLALTFEIIFLGYFTIILGKNYNDNREVASYWIVNLIILLFLNHGIKSIYSNLSFSMFSMSEFKFKSMNIDNILSAFSMNTAFNVIDGDIYINMMVLVYSIFIMVLCYKINLYMIEDMEV